MIKPALYQYIQVQRVLLTLVVLKRLDDLLSQKSTSPLAGEGKGAGAETKIYDYVYDNEDVILEYLTKTEDGKTKTETTRYIHGPGIDEPLAVTTNQGTYYYHADGLGSIVALTDSNGKTQQTYEYDSFGNLKDQKNKIKQPYTYTGREWDKEAGLYYYRARYYDAKTGRFVSKDPIGFKGGINLYQYVEENPILLTDPFGLASCCDAQLPASPIKEVALTCFAEASNNCSQGSNEKRAICDAIYNRAKANRSYWGGSSVLGVLKQTDKYGRYMFQGYQSTQYNLAANPSNLDTASCNKLKDCISAANAASLSQTYDYTSFNQAGTPTFCQHYFFKE